MAALLAFTLGPGTLASWRLGLWGWRLWKIAGSGSFVQVAGGLHRLDLWWRPVPVAFYPLTAALVEDRRGEWVLVDAGAGDTLSQSYSTELVAALRRRLGSKGRLRAVLLTHGHLDHAGGLPALLAAYPDLTVVAHEREAPFLTGSREYLVPGAAAAAARAVGALPAGPIKVPQSALRLLRGDAGGSLREFGIHSLEWVSAPGHTPGHVAFLHRPTSTLLAGDAVKLVCPSFSLAGGIERLLTRPLGWVARPFAFWVLAPARAAAAALAQSLATAANSSAGLSGLIGKVAGLAGGAGPAAALAGGGSAVSVDVGTFKLFPFLPGVHIRVSPYVGCPSPWWTDPATCDMRQAHLSICKLAALQGWERLLPMHDATGKGLSRTEVAGLAAALPACN